MSDCTTVRPLLAEAVYEELSTAQTAEVRRHLAACASCQAEFAALGEVRDALNAVGPVTPVRINFGGLYREATRRQTLRLRRWRRIAVAVTGVAALLLVVVLLRLEVRVDAQQLVLHWGATDDSLPKHRGPLLDRPPPVVEQRHVVAPPEVSADDLRLVKRLIHALAAQQELRDQSQAQELLALRLRLDQQRIQTEDRWETIERYISALQSTQSQLTRKE